MILVRKPTVDELFNGGPAWATVQGAFLFSPESIPIMCGVVFQTNILQQLCDDPPVLTTEVPSFGITPVSALQVSHEEKTLRQPESHQLSSLVANENTHSCFWRALAGEHQKQFDNLTAFAHIVESTAPKPQRVFYDRIMNAALPDVAVSV